MRLLLLQIIYFFIIVSQVSGDGPSDTEPPNAYCPSEFMHYVPEMENKSDSCECDKTFFYWPEDNECYDSWRQGYCPSGEYLILSPGGGKAICEENPCLYDGLVPFRGDCHFLWRSGPPCQNGSMYLGVNPESYELECSEARYEHYGPWERVKSSNSCPENSTFHPLFDEETNSSKPFCTCDIGYVYISENHTCVKAYRQNHCPERHYFVLHPETDELKCEKNPCLEDGLVLFQGSCHHLGWHGPPCDDDTTLEFINDNFTLACTKENIQGFFADSEVNLKRISDSPR